MLNHTELKDRASNDSKINDSKINDSKINDSKFNDSKSLYRNLSYVLLINDQFGFNDSVYRYLAEVINDNGYTAYFYSSVDYRITNASDFKFEKLTKPELFDESIYAFYAISKVLLEDRLKGLLEEYPKGFLEKYLKGLLEGFLEDITFAEQSLKSIDYFVSKLTKSEQQKSNFEWYRTKALVFLVKDEIRKLLSDEKVRKLLSDEKVRKLLSDEKVRKLLSDEKMLDLLLNENLLQLLSDEKGPSVFKYLTCSKN